MRSWAVCVLILSSTACKTKHAATTTATPYSEPEAVVSAPPWYCISDEMGTSCERTQAKCEYILALLASYDLVEPGVTCVAGSTAYCAFYTTYSGQVRDRCTLTVDECDEIAGEIGMPDETGWTNIFDGSVGACVETASDAPLPAATPLPAGWFCHEYEGVGTACQKTESNCRSGLEPEDSLCTAAPVAYCYTYSTTSGTLLRSCSETMEECSYDAEDMSSGMTMLPMDSDVDRTTVSACAETP